MGHNKIKRKYVPTNSEYAKNIAVSNNIGIIKIIIDIKYNNNIHIIQYSEQLLFNSKHNISRNKI